MPSRAPRIHVSRSETGFTNKKWAEAHLHFRNQEILPRSGPPKERKNGRYTLKNGARRVVRKRHSRELSAWSLQFPSLFFRTTRIRFPRTTSPRLTQPQIGSLST